MKENVSGCFFLNTVYLNHYRLWPTSLLALVRIQKQKDSRFSILPDLHHDG